MKKARCDYVSSFLLAWKLRNSCFAVKLIFHYKPFETTLFLL